MKKISVIIPTLNEEGNICNLLDDLYRDINYINEIIVVDGNSDDKTADLVKNHIVKARLIIHKRLVSAQRNKGIDLASSQLLLILDADTRIPKNFLRLSITYFEDKKLDIACPIYHPHDSNIYIKLLYHLFVNSFFLMTQYFLPSGGGPCIFVKKGLVEKHGGFNQKLKFDDIEFIRRLGKKGKFAIIPKAINVSGRRFKKYGATKMIVYYGLMSILFSLGLYKITNYLPYSFGKFSNQK